MKYLTTARRMLFGIPGILFWALGATFFYLAGGRPGVQVYLRTRHVK